MTSSRFARFLLTGGFAALVNLGSRYLLNQYMSFEAAVAVAYLFGVVTAYSLARLFVFKRSGHAIATEFRRFVIVNMVSLAVVWSVSVGLAVHLFPYLGFQWHAEAVAHFIGVASPTLIAYFAHKHYTFRAADSESPDAVPSGESPEPGPTKERAVF
jgi:putative flippase GtrA